MIRSLCGCPEMKISLDLYYGWHLPTANGRCHTLWHDLVAKHYKDNPNCLIKAYKDPAWGMRRNNGS